MRGYPVYIISLFLILNFSSRSLEQTQRLYLSKGKIVANRMSPAFSAIEDAFIMNELLDKTEPVEEKKINLKGLKVSGKATPVKFEKINLRGERIGVAHFTNKFITRKDLRLAAQAQPKVLIERSGEKAAEALAAAPSVNGLNRVELANGITITKIPSGPEASGVDKIFGGSPKRIFGSMASITNMPNNIAGEIDLQGELAGDNFTYYINRSLDGKVFESGVVDAENNKFRMEVGSLSGVLSVELRSEKGEVLAYGEQDLKSPGLNSNRLNIKIFPSETVLAGRVLDAAESIDGAEVAVDKAEKIVAGVQGSLEADDEGFFNEDLFEKGSSFIVQTKAKNYWSDLNFGTSGKPLYPRLINKKDFSDFAKTLDLFGEDVEITSALVGNISQKGLSQQNLQVKILNHEYQKPVYFNGLGAANPRLERTTTNGGFIFTNIPDGGYLVQAFRGKKLVAQKWYMVKESHISQGQLSIGVNPTMVASGESFPKTRGEETFVLHEIGAAEQSHILSSIEESQVKTVTTPELLALEIDKSDNYARHIYLTSSKSRKKRFKLVKKDWLEQFLNARRSNANRAKSFVVGFVGQNDFKIIRETTSAQSADSKVYYFDKYGESVDTGRIGGGFIITDVPSGLKSVVVSIKGRKTFLNKVVLTRPYSVSVF